MPNGSSPPLNPLNLNRIHTPAGMTRKVFRTQRTPRDIKSDPKIAGRIRTVKKGLKTNFFTKNDLEEVTLCSSNC
jgi:hypothetical protein